MQLYHNRKVFKIAEFQTCPRVVYKDSEYNVNTISFWPRVLNVGNEWSSAKWFSAYHGNFEFRPSEINVRAGTKWHKMTCLISVFYGCLMFFTTFNLYLKKYIRVKTITVAQRRNIHFLWVWVVGNRQRKNGAGTSLYLFIVLTFVMLIPISRLSFTFAITVDYCS